MTDSVNSVERLDIDLMGRQFSVSVKTDEREAFLAAVDMVQAKMRQLADKSPSGGETLALMTALNLAHEFVTSRGESGLDLPAYRRRIVSMGQQIDAALGKQEALF